MSDSKPKTKLLKKTVDFLLKCLQYIFDTGAVISLIGIAVVILYQIFARYALPKSPVWTEELARYLFIYSVILASGAVIVKERHVRLELFQHHFNKAGTLAYGIFCHLLVAAFCLVLLQYAWQYTAIGDRKTSPAMGIRMSWVFASTFIFFALVSLTSLLLVAKDLLCFFEKKEA